MLSLEIAPELGDDKSQGRRNCKDERHRRVERAYGAFTRSMRLPVGVDGSKVNATFKNGLLTITLPKTAAAKGVAIPIKAE